MRKTNIERIDAKHSLAVTLALALGVSFPSGVGAQAIRGGVAPIYAIGAEAAVSFAGARTVGIAMPNLSINAVPPAVAIIAAPMPVPSAVSAAPQAAAQAAFVAVDVRPVTADALSQTVDAMSGSVFDGSQAAASALKVADEGRMENADPAAKTDRQRALELHDTISRMTWKMVRLQIAVENAPENAENLQGIVQSFNALARQVSPMEASFLEGIIARVPVSAEQSEHYRQLSDALENIPQAAENLPQMKAAYDRFFDMKQELVGRVENIDSATSNELKQSAWLMPDFTMAANRLYAAAVASGLLPNDGDAKPLPEGPVPTPLSKEGRRHLRKAMASMRRNMATILSLTPRVYEAMGDAAQGMSSDISNSQAEGMIGRLSQAISNAAERLAESPDSPFLKAYSDAGRDFEAIFARLSEAVLSTVPPGQRMEVMTGLAGAVQKWMMAHIFSMNAIEMVDVLSRKTLECVAGIADQARVMPQEVKSSLPGLAQDSAKLEAAIKKLPQAGKTQVHH